MIRTSILGTLSLSLFLISNLSVASFPCNLNSLKITYKGVLPELVLTETSPDSYYSKVDQETLERLARKGRITLARQSLPFSLVPHNPSDHFGNTTGLVGYGDTLTLPLATIAKYNKLLLQPIEESLSDEADSESEQSHFNNSLPRNNPTGGNLTGGNLAVPFLSFISIVASDSFLIKEWFNLRQLQKFSTSASIQEQNISAVIDTYLDQNNAATKPNYAELRTSPLFQSDVSLQQVYIRFINAALRAYNKDYRLKAHPTLEMEEVDTSRFMKDSKFALNFTLDLWNQLIAENIAGLYCQAAQAEQLLLIETEPHRNKDLVPLLEKLSQGMVRIKTRSSEESSRKLFDSASPQMTTQALKANYAQFSSDDRSVQELIDTAETAARDIEAIEMKETVLQAQARGDFDPLNPLAGLPGADRPLVIKRPYPQSTNPIYKLFQKLH